MEEERKSNKSYIFVIIFLVVLVIVGAIILIKGKREKDSSLQTLEQSANITNIATATPEALLASPSGITNMQNVNELQITDEVVGTGAVAIAGKSVTVNYVGTLTNGAKFDSSFDRNEPFSFILGAGQVIEGWDKGVAGMKVGGKRKLIIPSSMAYGDNGIPGAIPGGATLVFEVELLKVE